MCAIIGGVNVTPEWVESGIEHQKMRGPDNTGIRTIGKVTFGHNRLSIIDLSEKSNQPVHLDGYMLSYNGEWYNHKEHSIHDHFNSDTLDLFSILLIKPFKEIGRAHV